MDYSRDILALNDKGLETFVRDWADVMAKGYLSVERFSGAGDKGRDIVGFLTKKLHEGAWHNYQCKQYGRTLPTENAMLELGKTLYYSFLGDFTVPEQYWFVAPRGVNRNLEKLLFKPTEFKETFIKSWPQYCSKKIIKDEKGTEIKLEGALLKHVKDFDFSTVGRISLDDILADGAAKPILFKYFGADIGAPPKGTVPLTVEERELPYIGQLLGAYGERDKASYATYKDVDGHPAHKTHLALQRVRFFEADYFNRFYRDNVLAEDLESLQEEIYHGIITKHGETHADSLSCVDAVMNQAAVVNPAGPLAKHARIPVRQGMCHHFANEERLKWKK